MEQGGGNEWFRDQLWNLWGRNSHLLPILRLKCDLRGRKCSFRQSQFWVECAHTVRGQRGKGCDNGWVGCWMWAMDEHPEPSLVTWYAQSDLWIT